MARTTRRSATNGRAVPWRAVTAAPVRTLSATVALLVASSSWPAPAAAASAPNVAPPRLGGQVALAFAQPLRGRALASLDVGLPRGFGLRMLIGPDFGRAGVGGQFHFGPTWSLDVTDWVPRLGVLVGVCLPTPALEVQLGGELARYVGLRTSLSVGMWAAWRQRGGFGGTGTLGLAYEL